MQHCEFANLKINRCVRSPDPAPKQNNLKHQFKMKTTIEISNYPLTIEFEEQILDFLARIKSHPNILIKVNATSTHLVGEFDEVMNALNQEIKVSFEKYGKMIFVMKVLNGALNLG